MKTVAISGGFDPVTIGHVRLIAAAAEYGNVVVILNSDPWLKRKKGYVFMDWWSRQEILVALRDVHNVVSVDDLDGTVCEALIHLRPDYFANGGDRNSENTPELKLCCDLGIKTLFSIGGEKISSSSEIVEKTKSIWEIARDG